MSPAKIQGEYRVYVETRDNLKAAFLLIVQVAFCYPISLRASQDYFFSRVVKNTRRFLFQVMCLISWGRRSFLNNLESGTIKDALPLYRPQPHKRKKKTLFQIVIPFATNALRATMLRGNCNSERDITRLCFVLWGQFEVDNDKSRKSLLRASIQLNTASAERRLVFSL